MIFRILIALGFVGFFLMPANFWVATMEGSRYLIANKIIKAINIIWGIAIITTMFIIIFTVPM